MKLTKNSELLMSFFLNIKCINHVSQTEKTDNILKKLVDVYKIQLKLLSSYQNSDLFKNTNTK